MAGGEPEGRGLAGVTAGETAVGHVDGERGELLYRGYSIAELAGRVNFEDAAYLLWQGELPDAAGREALTLLLADGRRLAAGGVEALRGLPRSTRPIVALRTLVSLLAAFERPGGDPGVAGEQGIARAARLAGAMAAGTAAFQRLRERMPVLEPRPGLTHAASLLWLVHGEPPDPRDARALDTALVLHLEHGFNASTFVARVAASTLAPLHACVTAAIGALEGPLHGGANEQVLTTLAEIGEPGRAADWVRARLAGHERIPGFGHRVYRGEDPRAAVLRAIATDLARRRGGERRLAVAAALEAAVAAELGGRGIAVNVDFYSPLVYQALGFPPDLFTPLFALARVVGWTAHIREQQSDNRLIRPLARYVGPARRALR